MKKQFSLKKATLLVAVLLWGMAVGVKAQTNLITNPGFEDNTNTVTDAAYNPSTLLLMRITSTTSTATATTQPAAASVTVSDGVWYKKQSMSSSILNAYHQPSDARSGTNCLMLRNGGGSGTQGITWSNFNFQQRLALENTKKYTFSFWAKRIFTVNSVKAFIADQSGNYGGAVFAVDVPLTGGGTWTKYTVQFDVPYIRSLNPALDYTTAYVGIGYDVAYNATPATITGQVLFDDLTLAESTTPVISSAAASTTDLNPIPITITFNNAVTGFISSDIAVTNGTVSNFSGSGTTYTADITPTSAGEIAINIAAGAATDGQSNATLAAAQFSRTYTAYYRSSASGNWATTATWQSSVDNANWVAATSAPTSVANAITIQNLHEITVAANATASALTVNGGGKLTLNNPFTLSVTSLNLLSDATDGTATVKDLNADGGLTVSGTTLVKQHLTTGRNWYIANPVVATALPTVASGTRTLHGYNEAIVTDAGGATGWVASPASFEVGKGYVASVSVSGDITFEGALNTGNKDIALTSRTGIANKAGFNLIGNPYASYLDWDAVMAANVDKLRSSTMWYRTQKRNQADELVYQFWTVNGDGIGVPNGASVKIPPMQSFWVRAVEGGSTLNLTNEMRSHAPATDKLLKAPAVNVYDKTLVRLQVSNGVNSDETVVYFSENALNGFDRYDAPKMSNGNPGIPEIFTIIDDERIVINSMPTIPFDTPIEVGFMAGNSSSFSIIANEITNLPDGVKLILSDHVTMIETDLTDGTSSYQFASDDKSIDRFSLIFRSPSTFTALHELNQSNARVYINSANQIVIDTTEECHFVIYNAIGQKVIEGITAKDQTIVDVKTLIGGVNGYGMYVVRIANDYSTKIIIH
jgi:hypothetical protein